MYVQYVTLSLTLIMGLACIIGLAYLCVNWERLGSFESLSIIFIFRICIGVFMTIGRPKRSENCNYSTKVYTVLERASSEYTGSGKLMNICTRSEHVERMGHWVSLHHLANESEKWKFSTQPASRASSGEKFEKSEIATDSDTQNQPRFTCSSRESNASPHLSCRT